MSVSKSRTPKLYDVAPETLFHTNVGVKSLISGPGEALDPGEVRVGTGREEERG